MSLHVDDKIGEKTDNDSDSLQIMNLTMSASLLLSNHHEMFVHEDHIQISYVKFVHLKVPKIMNTKSVKHMNTLLMFNAVSSLIFEKMNTSTKIDSSRYIFSYSNTLFFSDKSLKYI